MESQKYNFTRDELIAEVRDGTPLGKKMIEIEKRYIEWARRQELWKK